MRRSHHDVTIYWSGDRVFSPIAEQNLCVLLSSDPTPAEHVPRQRWHARVGGSATRVWRKNLRLAPDVIQKQTSKNAQKCRMVCNAK